MLGVYFSLDFLDSFSLIPALAGIAVLLGGSAAWSWAWPAVCYLAFMIPLPFQIETALSGPLQRLAIGVQHLYLAGPRLPGNGGRRYWSMENTRVGVSEACNGLGMLMAFFAISTAVALVCDRPVLDRVIIFLSAVPIGVLMNLVRITVTAIAHPNAGHRGRQSDLPRQRGVDDDAVRRGGDAAGAVAAGEIARDAEKRGRQAAAGAGENRRAGNVKPFIVESLDSPVPGPGDPSMPLDAVPSPRAVPAAEQVPVRGPEPYAARSLPPPPALSAPPSMESLLAVVGRRWVLMLLAGLVAGAAAGWFLAPGKYTAVAVIQLPKMKGISDGEELLNCSRSAAAVIKTTPVLDRVLEDPKVAGLSEVRQLQRPVGPG